MRIIGFYYAVGGPFPLYECDYLGSGWVSNIAYYDYIYEMLYSPSIMNLAENGRDMNGGRHPEYWWWSFVKSSYRSV